MPTRMQPVALDGQGLADREVAIDRDDLAVMEDQVGFLGMTRRPAPIADGRTRASEEPCLHAQCGSCVAARLASGKRLLWRISHAQPGNILARRRARGNPRGLDFPLVGPAPWSRPLRRVDRLRWDRLDAEASSRRRSRQAISPRAKRGESRWRHRASTARRSSGRVGLTDLRRVIRQLGLLQIDYFNVLAPAQYQVLFSRLGPYKKSLLDDLVYRRREFTEQWAHEASIVPVETWPLLRHRMDVHRVRPYGFEKFLESSRSTSRGCSRKCASAGRSAGGDLPEREGIACAARAFLVRHGRAGGARSPLRPRYARRGRSSARLHPRVRPLRADHSRGPPDRWSPAMTPQRELLRVAARGHGIGTAAGPGRLLSHARFATHDRGSPSWSRRVSCAKCESRAGGSRPTSTRVREHPGADRRRQPAVAVRPGHLVSSRAARLFDFEYRVEIFVPQAKRRWGCYVLPFLLGERLVARVDLKADRSRSHAGGRGRVPRIAREGRPGGACARTELQTMAGWLGLDVWPSRPR